MNAAWTILSDTAEHALFMDSDRGLRRSQPWESRHQAPRSKGTRVGESILVTRLHHLHRRVLHLARCPDNHQLRAKAFREAQNLTPSFPNLGGLGFFSWEMDAPIVAHEIAWEDALMPNEKKQTAWIKRKAATRCALQSQSAPLTAEQVRRVSVHPVHEVEAAAADWIPKWTCPPELTSAPRIAQLEQFLTEVPRINASDSCTVTWSLASLQRSLQGGCP